MLIIWSWPQNFNDGNSINFFSFFFLHLPLIDNNILYSGKLGLWWSAALSGVCNSSIVYCVIASNYVTMLVSLSIQFVSLCYNTTSDMVILIHKIEGILQGLVHTNIYQSHLLQSIAPVNCYQLPPNSTGSYKLLLKLNKNLL